MGHLQEQITEKQDGWQVETNEGTEFVPGDVVPVPEWLKTGAHMTADHDAAVFDALTDMVRDYVAGSRIESIEAISGHYFARMSAPGYLDCTEWWAFKTVKEARAYLADFQS